MVASPWHFPFFRTFDLDQSATAAPAQHRTMPEQPRPPLKNCPVCGVTMLAGKSDESLPHFDTFTCPNCRMVVSYARGRREPKQE
jgi:hypothetical protein